MLFDLRGRGRRRTVQAVFLGMALLFMLSFVGLGIGGGFGSGGILNAFTENSGSNSASFAGKVAAAQKRTQRHPSEAAAWAALAEAQLHQASEPEYITVAGEREQYTSKGLKLLTEVSSSWNTYLKLEPHHANAELAQKIASVYSEQGLSQPAEAVRALQIAIAGKPPSAGLYSELAVSAYEARHTSEGDLATGKALKLMPAGERPRAKKYLAELRKNPLAHVPAIVSKLPNGTYVETQAGNVYTVNRAPNGSFTKVPVAHGTTTTPSAEHTSSSAKKK